MHIIFNGGTFNFNSLFVSLFEDELVEFISSDGDFEETDGDGWTILDSLSSFEAHKS